MYLSKVLVGKSYWMDGTVIHILIPFFKSIWHKDSGVGFSCRCCICGFLCIVLLPSYNTLNMVSVEISSWMFKLKWDCN